MPVMQIAAPEQPRQVVDARGAVRFPAHATHMRSRSPPGRRHMPTHRGGQTRPSSGPAGVNRPILKPLFPIMPEFQVGNSVRNRLDGTTRIPATHSVRTASIHGRFRPLLHFYHIQPPEQQRICSLMPHQMRGKVLPPDFLYSTFLSSCAPHAALHRSSIR